MLTRRVSEGQYTRKIPLLTRRVMIDIISESWH
jgi:hypothetical protein